MRKRFIDKRMVLLTIIMMSGVLFSVVLHGQVRPSLQRAVRLNNANGSNSVSLSSPNSLATSFTLEMPTVLGESGQVLGAGAVNGNVNSLQWATVLSAQTGWTLNGNSTTDAWNGSSGSRLGTTTAQPLVLVTSATERIRISASGLVGIGNTNPVSALDVTGNGDFSGSLSAGDMGSPGSYYVEGAGFLPALLGQRTVSAANSSSYRGIGVMGHVLVTGKIDNRAMGGAFYVSSDATNTENMAQFRALQGWSTHTGTGTLTNAWSAYLVVTNKSTGTITNAYGAVAGVENGSTGTVNKLHALSVEAWNNKGGRVDTLFGLTVSVYNSHAASSIGAVYGISIGRGMITNTGGTHFWRNYGTINNSYGLYLDPAIDVGNNRFAIYSLSTSVSRFSGHLELGNTDNNARELRLFEPDQNGNNYTAFKSAAQNADIVYTMPASPPVSGQVLSAGTASSNVLEWVSPAMLPLRLTTVQRDALISPVPGIIIFNTDLNKHQAWDGTLWRVFY